MSLRMKLADWISGGAVEACSLWRSAYRDADRDRQMAYSEEGRARAALARIAKMETPSANATVRRMANTARKALGE